MIKKSDSLDKIYNEIYRDPKEVFFQSLEPKFKTYKKKSLDYYADESFTKLVKKLGITLFLTREYEHLVLAFNYSKGSLNQSYFHLPHPSGLVIDKKTKAMYIASTRNPNQIWEFLPLNDFHKRKDYDYLKTKEKNETKGLYFPSRTKVLAGSNYIHDLALIGGDLYANAVGTNSIIRVDFNSSHFDKSVWFPKSIGKKKQDLNYLQLNSIASGKTLEESYFSASIEKPGRYKPGDLNFKVDKNGVIFSGKNKSVIAKGLTRPHSARLHKNKLWVDNSGYGELGYVEDNKFIPTNKFDGWTRGLTFIGDYAFVGVSKVLKRFKVYAPGVNRNKSSCFVAAINIKTNKVVGYLRFPYGNQIFSIDYINSNLSKGFLFTSDEKYSKIVRDVFYGYKF